jgi:Protein of unknown function (DUF3102)
LSEIEKRLGKLAEQINGEHRKVEVAMGKALGHGKRAGKLLVEAKERTRHGEWLPWLEGNFEGTPRRAQQYMRIYSQWAEIEANTKQISDLTLTEALKIIGSPRENILTREPIEGPLHWPVEKDAPIRVRRYGDLEHTEPREPGAIAQPEPTPEGTTQTPPSAPKVKINNKEYTQTEVQNLIKDLRKEIREAKEDRADYAKEIQRTKEQDVETIESQFAAEMAELKVKYGDVEEPRFAHLPAEHWERLISEAKSQRVMDVARHLADVSGWADWMGRYFPEEAAEAIEDMEGKEDLINGWNYIIDWMEKVRDELEERGLRGW